jgi:hypothetical protein
MPDSRDPIGIRRAVLVPSQGNGTCAVCLHAYATLTYRTTRPRKADSYVLPPVPHAQMEGRPLR